MKEGINAKKKRLFKAFKILDSWLPTLATASIVNS